jgi:hypothetical protein
VHRSGLWLQRCLGLAVFRFGHRMCAGFVLSVGRVEPWPLAVFRSGSAVLGPWPVAVLRRDKTRALAKEDHTSQNSIH